MCSKSLCSKKQYEKKFTFDFLKIAEKFWFIIFALKISSDESQVKHSLTYKT